jgi:hypothetical protein
MISFAEISLPETHVFELATREEKGQFGTVEMASAVA